MAYRHQPVAVHKEDIMETRSLYGSPGTAYETHDDQHTVHVREFELDPDGGTSAFVSVDIHPRKNTMPRRVNSGVVQDGKVYLTIGETHLFMTPPEARAVVAKLTDVL